MLSGPGWNHPGPLHQSRRFSGSLIFPFLAPILFHGKDMVEVGQAFVLPIALVFGVIGLFVGLARSKKKSSARNRRSPRTPCR